MKKILTLLLGGLLTSITVNTVISCKSNIIPTESNDDLNYQGDLKILNGITKHISDVFSQYADEKKIDINNYPIPEFENLFSIVTATKPTQVLNLLIIKWSLHY